MKCYRDLNVKAVKRLGKREIGCLGELMNHMDMSTDTRQIFVFRDGGRIVGGMVVDFEVHKLIQGEIYLGVYIGKIEVVKKYRGQGYGRAMVEWLMNRYNIFQIEISHIAKNIDGGAAYRFWRRMGFWKRDASTTLMTKVLLK